MAHLALYRTYRPSDFDSVVGQKHIVQTVRNQINNKLLAHAYMLTGPRGTGKTSIARIVAKAINCSEPRNGNPCNACESCRAVNAGNHPDVFELDGASNNGVDEIRDIRDRVKYSPSLSAYKVYIIDEVHMLSTGAFNALLKTLEEPPAHVVFMLATTEIHKVPETILSRCQRFDLKQIPTPDMTNHLVRILSELGIGFEEGVPGLVASLAGGGLRDALSMLDQAIAYKTDVVKISDIHDLNGSVSTHALGQIIEHSISGDFSEVIGKTRILLENGKLPIRIIDGLLAVLRDTLKVQKLGFPDTTGIASKISTVQVLTYIKKLNSLAHELKIATDAELILEVGLIELGLDTTAAATRAAAGTPVAKSAATSSDYSIEVKVLMRQVKELQDEVAELKTLEKTAKASQTVSNEKPVKAVLELPSFSEPPQNPGFPVFVQGELVNDAVETIAEADMPKGDVGKEDILIEEILNCATKTDKSDLQGKVANRNAFAKIDLKEVVMLLKDADIAAASPEGCILVYDYETTAQKLLTAENREKLNGILAEMYGKKYGFISLPKDFWLQQRENYVAQKRMGQSPRLEQYPQRVGTKSEKTETDEPFYQDVVNMFGDIVEVID